MKGVFITFEGPEGSGKSTQLQRLALRLRETGREVVTTREPGGTPTGEAIRGLLQHETAGEPLCAAAETLLFEASRAQLVCHVVRPALQRGAIVLCDRFADSTTAYQGYGRGFDIETLEQLHAFALGDTWPTRTLLLDLDVDIGLQRIRQRAVDDGAGLDRMEREPQDFHRRVAAGYRELAVRWPARFRVVAAARPSEAVHADVWRWVGEVLA